MKYEIIARLFDETQSIMEEYDVKSMSLHLQKVMEAATRGSNRKKVIGNTEESGGDDKDIMSWNEKTRAQRYGAYINHESPSAEDYINDLLAELYPDEMKSPFDKSED